MTAKIKMNIHPWPPNAVLKRYAYESGFSRQKAYLAGKRVLAILFPQAFAI